MEMEFFVPPAEADQWYEHWCQARYDWYVELGMDPEKLRLRPHEADELSHYSSATSDVEYLFPWGWDELERSEEHTSELQSLMRSSYAVFCLKKKKYHHKNHVVID